MPEVRDSLSLARAYNRIGFPHRREGRYETRAALRGWGARGSRLKGHKSPVRLLALKESR